MRLVFTEVFTETEEEEDEQEQGYGGKEEKRRKQIISPKLSSSSIYASKQNQNSINHSKNKSLTSPIGLQSRRRRRKATRISAKHRLKTVSHFQVSNMTNGNKWSQT